jgi:hypothetical protein
MILGATNWQSCQALRSQSQALQARYLADLGLYAVEFWRCFPRLSGLCQVAPKSTSAGCLGFALIPRARDRRPNMCTWIRQEPPCTLFIVQVGSAMGMAAHSTATVTVQATLSNPRAYASAPLPLA